MRVTEPVGIIGWIAIWSSETDIIQFDELFDERRLLRIGHFSHSCEARINLFCLKYYRLDADFWHGLGGLGLSNIR